MVAVYKGLKVTVYSVDKPELNLTRQDLIELVNVCSILPHYCIYHFPMYGTVYHVC